MNVADFLTLLWRDQPPGLIQTWQLDGRHSRYFRSPYGTRVLDGTVDAYTCVALTHKDHGRAHRARADQAIALAGLWLDLDVNGGPDQKTNACPTLDDAHQLAGTITAPTLTVHSGYGLHAWYLFTEPWRFTSRAEQQHAALAAAQWGALHRAAAAEHGWRLDSTHDLARLMRLPGTLNGKGGHHQPVTASHAAGPRYERDVLLELAAQAGDQPTVTQLRLPADAPIIQASTDAEAPSLKLEALLQNSPEFAAAWHHQLGPRAANWSLSEYDLSLCSQAAAANWTDQELADLIAQHRRAWDPAGNKAGRGDYVRRTISKARAAGERQAALDTLRRAAA